MDIPVTREVLNSPCRQIAAWLRKEIESGGFAPGQQMPTETELMKATDCAATTVRRAVRLLRDEGIVVTVPGRGSYVAVREQAG